MKITKQRLKQIIKEEMQYAMEQEAGEDPAASSKNALANFFKEKYNFLVGSESAEVKLNTAEIQAVAKFVDSLIKVAALEGNSTRDLLISLQKLVDSSSGKGMADPAAAQGEKETLTV
jgi:hypothetical protein